MSPNISQILTKNKKKTFPLNRNLTCTNYGRYVATCVIRDQQYNGQTVNNISTKWTSHPSNWNKPDTVSWMTGPNSFAAELFSVPRHNKYTTYL